MYDSHCHLDDEPYAADRAEVLTRAANAGVVGILVPGFAPHEWLGLKALCAQHESLRCAVGLHPWYVHTLTANELARALDGLADSLRAQGAVAVGECGLDKPKASSGGAALGVQRQVLEAQLLVARRLGLPVVLHCVGAHALLLEVLELGGPLAAGGVMHSYSGSAELVPRYAALGLSFSFAGILTREQAARPKRACAAVPLARLLVESDGPDQAAAHVLPRRSEPAHVSLVLEAMAALRGEDIVALTAATTRNAQALFERKLAR